MNKKLRVLSTIALTSTLGLALTTGLASCGFKKIGTTTSTISTSSPIENTNTATTTSKSTNAGSSTTTTTGSQINESADLVKDTDGVYVISNGSQLNAFRALASTTDSFKLTADIDMSGYTLETTAIDFAGNFDGQGHTISNVSYVSGSAKTGFLVAKMSAGVIQNVKFTNVNCTNANETIGVVAGLCEGGKFKQIEFNSCSAVTTNNYSGLLFGRNTSAGNIFVSEVTAKNGTFTSSASYGGFLIGDAVAGTSVTANDLDLDGEFKNSSQNGSFVFGRSRGGTYTLKNSVIKAKLEIGTNSDAVIVGGANASTVTVENVLVNATANSALSHLKTGSTISVKNCYTVNTIGNAKATDLINTEAAFTSVAESSVNPTWLKDTLGLDFTEKWVTEGEDNGKYRLACASTNVKSADATIVSLKVSTANATTRFKQGNEFTSEGVVVTGVYSDGVQLILSSDEFTIDSAAYKNTEDGTYEIFVTSTENAAVSTSYNVKMVHQTGFSVNSEFATKTYVANSDYDDTNVIVYSLWSDNVSEELEKDSYTIDSSAYNKSKAGAYTISITNGNFDAQTYQVSVVETTPTVVSRYVYVNVDASSTVEFNGQQVNGVETFKTLSSAVEYLTALGLDSDVTKVVYLSAGTYTEKVTVPASLTNLHLVGTGDDFDKTVLTYSAVEDTVNVTTGSMYGLDCATLHVNATGFAAYNLSIRNDFDYINEAKKHSDPQGLALTINGDGALLYNVHLFGNQDTFYLKSGRVYAYKSTIEGNVDFIFGQNNGIGFFEECTINAVYRNSSTNNGYVTAMKADSTNKPDYGYVFYKCEFTADSEVVAGTQSLARTWGPAATAAYINCSFSAAYSLTGYGSSAVDRWEDMSGNSPVNADFVEYGSTGAGSITEAVTGGSILTEEQAANYTAVNTFAKTNGKVSWSTEFDYTTALATLKDETSKVASTAIESASSEIKVSVGYTTDLLAFVSPWNALNKSFTAKVTDETVCTYENGVVTGLKEGTTTIVFTQESISYTVTVKVIDAVYYDVTFVTNGTAVETQSVVSGDKITAVTSTLTGYVFAGWYTDKAFTVAFDVDNDVISGNTVLYAKFNPAFIFDAAKVYNNGITFAGQNGTCVLLPTLGATATGTEGTTVDRVTSFTTASFTTLSKKATIYVLGGTNSSGNAFTVNATAFDSKGNQIGTATGQLLGGKVTAECALTISATKNISYVKVDFVNGDKTYGVLYASVVYDSNLTAENSYSVTFGSEGNYSKYVGSSVSVSNHATEPTSQVNGSIELDVKAGGVVVVTGYPGVYAYTISDGNNTVTATSEVTSFQVKEDSTITVASTKYLYSIDVIYPIAVDSSYTYADGTLTSGNGLSFSYVVGKTVNDNAGCYQFKSSKYNEVAFTVAASSKVTVIGHSAGYGLMDIYVNGVKKELTISSTGTYEFDVEAYDLVEVRGYEASISNSYIKGVTVDVK